MIIRIGPILKSSQTLQRTCDLHSACQLLAIGRNGNASADEPKRLIARSQSLDLPSGQSCSRRVIHVDASHLLFARGPCLLCGCRAEVWSMPLIASLLATVYSLEPVSIHQPLPVRKVTETRICRDLKIMRSADSATTRTWKSRRFKWTTIITAGTLGLLMLMFLAFGIVHIIIVVLGRASFLGIVPGLQRALAVIQPTYRVTAPTFPIESITQDVVPIPCHSHNDYWRAVPLFDALHAGCTSVEADLWLLPGDHEIYVGHDRGSLSDRRTLRGMYLNPIHDLLRRSNLGSHENNITRRGVFDTAPGQTLVLLLDLKSDGNQLLPLVQAELDSLRNDHYISFWDGQHLNSRAITVVLSGNIPHSINDSTVRHNDLFIDAPLDELWNPTDQTAAHSSTISPLHTPACPSPPCREARTAFYASASFSATIGHAAMGQLSAGQIDTIRGHIRGAHEKGLKARYWDTPAWPVSLRNYIWQLLLDEGSDVLNVDDLHAAASLDWNVVRHDWFNG